jgi:hypothetical protein
VVRVVRGREGYLLRHRYVRCGGGHRRWRGGYGGRVGRGRRRRDDRWKRGGLQKLLPGILRARENELNPIFDRARTGHTRVVGVEWRDKQRAGRDDCERGDLALPAALPVPLLQPLPAAAVLPGPGSRYRTQRLDAPVRRVLPGRERDDEQPARGEACELLVRQVGEGDRELPAGPYGHARDGCAIMRRRELRHARRGQWRVLAECSVVLVVQAVVVSRCDNFLKLSLGFCFGEDPTTNRRVSTRS